jgi:hypothetical protein
VLFVGAVADQSRRNARKRMGETLEQCRWKFDGDHLSGPLGRKKKTNIGRTSVLKNCRDEVIGF